MTVAENVKPLASIVPQTIASATTTAGAAVDTMGYDNVEWVIAVGDLDLVGGDETHTIKIQESVDAAFSSPVDITGATVAMTADSTVKTIKVLGLGTGSRLRYQRAYVTTVGATVSCPICVLAALGGAKMNPCNTPDA
ncbi:MAG: hypothetical protein WCV84_04625 [Patescibacteria group bacterium]